ncbi:LytTR family transcriptional regulator [Roseovarius gahaiensis]|uniref:LytTR family transcriptional regulator n=1 Tax=Roseovarius gahaiensis TaxID=2716691 RepID=A0A967EH89_9RHOB|nr:LytTR family DNA-binding domain-containing protein [Roseovarius gahaiensis]NHQ75931.1 LytTR family transcriptional regulator [Roseovarius gahaiensis]
MNAGVVSKLGKIRAVFAQTYATIFSPLTFFIWAISIVLATTAGPFGSYEAMHWPLRLTYWLLIVTMGIVFGYAVRALAVIVVGFARPVLFDIFASVTMGLTFGPVVWMIRKAFQPANIDFPVQLPDVMLNTFLISVAVFVVRRQICQTEPGAYLLNDGGFVGSAQDKPRLLRRLSEDQRGQVLRLTAKDHYVDIVSDKGTATIRMRLADAIDEMEPVEGYCVHRSHWVARTGIVGVERENPHKLFVVLSNGDRVPLSRKYRPSLEKAGIIAPPQKTSAEVVKG